MKLYFSTGSCSLASHIVLEESGARFETQKLNLREGDQKKPEYLRINPKSKVPSLVLDDGKVLTENPAIMSYVADLHPEAKLLAPPGQYDRARAQEWMAWCASTVHPAFSPLFGNAAARFVDGEEAQKSFKEKMRGMLQGHLDHFDQWIGGPYVLGSQFSVADAYTLVFFAWAKTFQMSIGERWRASATALLARPGVQRALATQGLKLEA
jgi:glutathione S-transferase